MLVEGTAAECAGVGDHERGHSGEVRGRGMNIQAVADPAGEPIGYSSALPGRTYRAVDITATRTRRIVTICEGSASETGAPAGDHVRNCAPLVSRTRE